MPALWKFPNEYALGPNEKEIQIVMHELIRAVTSQACTQIKAGFCPKAACEWELYANKGCDLSSEMVRMLPQLERGLDTPPRSLGQRDWWILLPWKRNQARCPNPSIMCPSPPPHPPGGGREAAWLSIMVSTMPPGLAHPVRNPRGKWRGQGLWRSATRIRELVPWREFSLLSEGMIHPLVRLMGGSKPLLPNGSTNECCEHDYTYQRGSL